MKKILLLCILIVLITGCAPKMREAISQDIEEAVLPLVVERVMLQNPNPLSLEKEPRIHHVSISAVGDLMFHEYQLARSYDSHTGEFNFEDTFTEVVPYLTEADLTVGNLETTLAGANNSRCLGELSVAGYSGFPCFNTPDVVLDTIKNAGFDLVTTANNHSLDSGLDGLKRTLRLLDMKQILHVGTYSTKKMSERIKMMEINHITFAFISMTYATNGFEVPEEAPFCINTLENYMPEKEEEMCQLVREAKALNPDFIVVMPHFGTEYWDTQDSYQEAVSEAMFEAGADIILGSHPHVLEPIQIKEVTREDGTKAQGFVIYSMGNFISSQKEEMGMQKDLGVILTLDFEKVDFKKATIKGFSLVPTYTYWTRETIGVLPVDETLEKIETNAIVMPKYDINRLKFAQNYSIKHLMTYLEEYPIEYDNHRYYVALQ